MEWKDTVYGKRLRLLLAAAAVLWILFLWRFYYLQIASHEELAEMAALQYQVPVEGLDSRGQIYDRNLQPLTGRVKQYCYFLPGERMNPGAVNLLESVLAEEISDQEKNHSSYTVWRTEFFDETIHRKLKEEYGAYVLCIPSRYSSSQTAAHLIGYLNQAEKTGAAGLERAFEERLRSDGSRLSLQADGSGRLLQSAAPVLQETENLHQSGLVTTLEVNLQNLCEKIVAEQSLTGAVLVSHAESGEMLAWVSAPSFRPNTLETRIDGQGDQLVNKCIQGTYAPGSLFELVYRTAALERKTVMEMAETLGFGQPVMGIFMEESAGILPVQGDTAPENISVTPVQIHQMMSAAAAGGILQPLTVVRQAPLPAKHLFSAETAQRLTSLLEAGMRGKAAASGGIGASGDSAADGDWPCPVYGRTADAAGTLNGRTVGHCWFSGFCRVGDDTFVVTVLAEDGRSAEADCLPVFREITEYLAVKGSSVVSTQ